MDEEHKNLIELSNIDEIEIQRSQEHNSLSLIEKLSKQTMLKKQAYNKTKKLNSNNQSVTDSNNQRTNELKQKKEEQKAKWVPATEQEYIDWKLKQKVLKEDQKNKKPQKQLSRQELVHQSIQHLSTNIILNKQEEEEDETFKKRWELQTMRHATQEKFDRIEIEYPKEQPICYENKQLLPKWGQRILWFENSLTAKNVFIFVLFLAVFVVAVLPEMLYIASVFDRHYIGYFSSALPFASTTLQEKYYKENNIPYINTAQLRRKQKEYERRKRLGLPQDFEIEFKQYFTFAHGLKLVTDWLKMQFNYQYFVDQRNISRKQEFEEQIFNEPTVRMLQDKKSKTPQDLKEPSEVGKRNNETFKIFDWTLGIQITIKCDRKLDDNCPPKEEEQPKAQALKQENSTTNSTKQPPKMPAPVLDYDSIKNGGFVAYLIVMMYSFLGISLVTQNYLNPAIDDIKKKGILGSDTMNATLLAFSNSAAESFIVIISIFAGVPDIGIQTAAQQSTFYALVIQGIFYLYTEEGTRIDWWISIRDSVLFIVYLAFMSFFIFSLKIEAYAYFVLLGLFIIHVFLMKQNHSVEVALKKFVANFFEIRELSKLAKENIGHFHFNLDSRSPSIEVLNKINFRQEGDFLVFEGNAKWMQVATGLKGQFMSKNQNEIRYRMRPIQSVKIRDERFATPEDVRLLARARFKQAVIKILTKLQAFSIQEKIKRNKHCIIPSSSFIKHHQNDNKAQGIKNLLFKGLLGKNKQQETQKSDHSSDIINEENEQSEELSDSSQEPANKSNIGSVQGQSEKVSQAPGPGFRSAKTVTENESVAGKSDNKSVRSDEESQFESEVATKMDWQKIFLQEKMVGEPQAIPQSVIYKLINETINKEAFSIEIPTGWKNILWYIFVLPHTHLQYISIPSPLSKRNSNYYPLTIFCGVIWIALYCFIIVWFTYDLTKAFNMPYSILPMFLYPFGISLRDKKKFDDFAIAISVFKQELPDQQISLAETYAPQIFQMTGLAGLAWTIYGIAFSEIIFEQQTIKFQIPILIGVILIKIGFLAYNKFKTRKAMFKSNILIYILVLGIILFLEFGRTLIGLA